jgi:hypothetical protein
MLGCSGEARGLAEQRVVAAVSASTRLSGEQRVQTMLRRPLRIWVVRHLDAEPPQPWRCDLHEQRGFALAPVAYFREPSR